MASVPRAAHFCAVYWGTERFFMRIHLPVSMTVSMTASLAALLVLSVTPMLAHHSFEAEYDEKKPVALAGAVSKVDWMNPHIWVHINVKDDKGAVAVWSCEGGN